MKKTGLIQRFQILWNIKSGSAEKRQEILEEVESLHSDEVEVEHYFPSSAHEAIEWTKEAPEDTVIVAAGGDGTVHAVAQGVIERQAEKHDRAEHSDGKHSKSNLDRDRSSKGPALGVLPLGTANDFVRSLGIPVNPSLALAALLRGERRYLDVVRFSVDGREDEWMINVAAGGNAAEVSRRLNPEQKNRWGPWSYVGGVVDVAGEMQVYPVALHLDDDPPRELNSLNLVFANGRTAATLEVASQANLEDGRLDVVIVKEGNFMETAQLAADFFASDYLQSDQVFFRRARKVHLESERRICFSIDGELHWGNTFTYEIWPSLLPAIVGSDYPAKNSREIP